MHVSNRNVYKCGTASLLRKNDTVYEHFPMATCTYHFVNDINTIFDWIVNIVVFALLIFLE